MANLVNLTHTGKLNRKKGTGTATITDISATMFTQSSPNDLPISGTEFTTEISHTNFEIAHDPYNAGRFVVAYVDENNSNKATARIGRSLGSSNSNIIWGTPVVCDNANQTPDMICVAFCPTRPNMFIMTHNSGKLSCTTGTITNNDTITFGGDNYNSQMQFGMGGVLPCIAIAFNPNTTGQFVIAYRRTDGQGEAASGQLNSNGSQTLQPSQVFHTSAVGTGDHGLDIKFDPNTSDDRFVITWVDGSAPWLGRARCGDVHGSGFSWGTTTTFSTDATVKYPSLSWDPNTANKFVVSYTKDHNSTDVCCAKVGNCASNQDLTFGTEAAYRTNGAYGRVAFNPNLAGSLIIAFRKLTSYDVFAIKGTVTYGSPDTIAYTGTGIEFRDGANINWAFLSLAFDSVFAGKFYVAHGFRDNANDTAGHVMVGRTRESKLAVDLSQGDSFELDLETATHNIEKFTITESIASGKTQMFFLKILQGSTARQFDWAGMNTVELKCSYLINGRGTHEVDVIGPATTADLAIGMLVTGTNIPSGTTIASIANSTTFVLSAAPSAATTGILTCVLNNIKWSGGTGPTITATNNAVDVLSFITFDEGTTWYGNIEGQDIK